MILLWLLLDLASPAMARKSLISGLCADVWHADGIPGLERVGGRLPLPTIKTNQNVRLPGNGVYSAWSFDMEAPRQIAAFEVTFPDGRAAALRELEKRWGPGRPIHERNGIEFRGYWRDFIYIFPDGADGFSFAEYPAIRPRFAYSPRSEDETRRLIGNLAGLLADGLSLPNLVRRLGAPREDGWGQGASWDFRESHLRDQVFDIRVDFDPPMPKGPLTQALHGSCEGRSKDPSRRVVKFDCEDNRVESLEICESECSCRGVICDY
jgi:hypothetical protein